MISEGFKGGNKRKPDSLWRCFVVLVVNRASEVTQPALSMHPLFVEILFRVLNDRGFQGGSAGLPAFGLPVPSKLSLSIQHVLLLNIISLYCRKNSGGHGDGDLL